MDNQPISLSLPRTTLKELFRVIESKSDYKFLYDSSEIDVNRQLSAVYSNQSVTRILEEVLKGMHYEIKGKQIIIKKQPEDLQKIAVTGIIKDRNGEPVIGANVKEKGSQNGTITNVDGSFSLSVSPRGTLLVSFIGYTSQEVALKGRKSLEITLLEDSKMLDEVVIVSYGLSLIHI